MYASPRKLAGLLNTVLPELRVFPRPQASAEGDSAPARGARAGHALRGADLPKPAAIGRAQVATATQGRAGTAHERAAGEPAGADGAAGGAHEPTQGVLRYLSRTLTTHCALPVTHPHQSWYVVRCVSRNLGLMKLLKVCCLICHAFSLYMVCFTLCYLSRNLGLMELLKVCCVTCHTHVWCVNALRYASRSLTRHGSTRYISRHPCGLDSDALCCGLGRRKSLWSVALLVMNSNYMWLCYTLPFLSHTRLIIVAWRDPHCGHFLLNVSRNQLKGNRTKWMRLYVSEKQVFWDLADFLEMWKAPIELLGNTLYASDLKKKIFKPHQMNHISSPISVRWTRLLKFSIRAGKTCMTNWKRKRELIHFVLSLAGR